MEYGQREPMKSASAKEPTAFTMKSIKELLADEAKAFGEAVTKRMPLPKSPVQQPPHMRGAAPDPAQIKPKPAAKPALKATVAPKIDAEMTAPPTAIPESVRAAAHAAAATPTPAAAPPVETQPVTKPRSFFGRLLGA